MLQLGKEVWERVRISTGTVLQPPIDTYSVKEWWSASLRNLPKQLRRTTVALHIYTD